MEAQKVNTIKPSSAKLSSDVRDTVSAVHVWELDRELFVLFMNGRK